MKRMRRMAVLCLAAVMVSMVSAAAFPFFPIDELLPLESAEIDHFDAYGNLYLTISADTLLDEGYEYGDLVYVSINDDLMLEMPFVTAESDVDAGEDYLLSTTGRLLIAVRSGSFEDAYHLDADDELKIFLSEKAGYLSEYNIRHGIYSLDLSPDFDEEKYWVERDMTADKAADAFLVGPTVDWGEDGDRNMSLEDMNYLISYLEEVNKEKGIFSDDCNIYAPFYRQATLEVFTLDEDEEESYLDFAYQDIYDAFAWYLENTEEDRPLVLFGYSQGAYMVLRLLDDFFDDQALRDRLVAVYAIGWCITEEELADHPNWHMAQGEYDTGVIISYDCEAESVTGTLVVPEGEKMLSINPLNWSTGSDYADASLNIGTCYMDFTGRVYREFTHVTGCYVDPDRGTLKCPDLNPRLFTTDVPYFELGEYHPYDYNLFYRNLQANVGTRIASLLSGETKTVRLQSYQLNLIWAGALLAALVGGGVGLALGAKRRKRRYAL